MNIQPPHELQKILKNTLNTQIDIHPINPITRKYKVKFSNLWNNNPKATPPPPLTNYKTTPLPNQYNHIHSLKFHPQKCTYTDGSIIPPSKNSEGQIEGNTAWSGVYSPNNNTRISERLLGYPKHPESKDQCNTHSHHQYTKHPNRNTHVYR